MDTNQKRWSSAVETPVGSTRICGRVAPGFEPLAEAFCDNFTARGEVAASVHLEWRGKEVLSLWGGRVSDTQDWHEDTLSVVFSATKPATALCIHLLAQRGVIALDAPVADYWPAFASHGKDGISVDMVLDHSAGVPALTEPLKPDCLTDHAYMAQALEQAHPMFVPGTRTAYHPVTGGFILAEIIRRTDGRTLGQFFAEEIAAPLGIEFWLGLPEDQDHRVAPIRHFVPQKGGAPTAFGMALRDKTSPQALFFFNHGDWMAKGVNTRAGRAAEIGAASGITNARGLARLHGAMRPEGRLGLTQDTCDRFTRTTSATHCDGMLLQPTRFGGGFMHRMDNRSSADRPTRGDSFLIPDQAFGHVGAGGSFAFCDPSRDLAIGYAMTQMGEGFLVNDRGAALIAALNACDLGAPT
ncbi:serine hydrolase domain-containing protein [Pseudophaeobacter arcticus]|uniref:Serine hydrolase domain-containing protein n=1 Tax=Pseudophaeobacter arcticus TaxID=385492 RepID=A0ABQ0AH21_9RHOB